MAFVFIYAEVGVFHQPDNLDKCSLKSVKPTASL